MVWIEGHYRLKLSSPIRQMVIRGLRAIANYMGWKSPMTPLRHHEREPAWLAFPMLPLPTGKGQGIVWVSDTELIKLWIMRQSEESARAQKTRLKRRRKRKEIQIGETREALALAERKARLREELSRATPTEKSWMMAHELTAEERAWLQAGEDTEPPGKE